MEYITFVSNVNEIESVDNHEILSKEYFTIQLIAYSVRKTYNQAQG